MEKFNYHLLVETIERKGIHQCVDSQSYNAVLQPVFVASKITPFLLCSMAKSNFTVQLRLRIIICGISCFHSIHAAYNIHWPFTATQLQAAWQIAMWRKPFAINSFSIDSLWNHHTSLSMCIDCGVAKSEQIKMWTHFMMALVRWDKAECIS